MTDTPRHRLDSQRPKEAPLPLHAFLGSHRGSNVEIDVGGITSLGARQLELILVADRQWQADGCQLRLTNLTPELAAWLTGFDLPTRLYSNGG